MLEIGTGRDAASRLDEDEKADVGITDASSNGVPTVHIIEGRSTVGTIDTHGVVIHDPIGRLQAAQYRAVQNQGLVCTRRLNFQPFKFK